MSGFSATTGFPGRAPLKTGVWIGDYTGALFAVLGILSALHYKRKTGKGQIIDVSQGESLVRCLDWTWLYLTRFGKERGLHGNRDIAISPSAVFRCKDGFIAVAAINDLQFSGLCAAINQPEMARDERFETFAARVGEENGHTLHGILSSWALTQTRDEIEKLAEVHGFAAHRVSTSKDHYHDEHLKSRGAVWNFEDPVYGEAVEYGPGPKLSASPGRMRWMAKPVGFHNDYVFTEVLGLSSEEIVELEEKKVIGRWADRPGAKPPDGWRDEDGGC